MSQIRPNKAVVPVNSDAYNLTADLATFADSLNVPIRVASQAERDALTKAAGLLVSRTDLGGLLEVCDGTNWTKGLQHAEFTASTSPTGGALWGPGALAIDTNSSTNYGFATSPSNDRVALSPGIYSVFCRYVMSVNATGTSFGAIVNDNNTNTYTSSDIAAGYSTVSVQRGNINLTTAQNIRFTFSSGAATGYTLTTRIAITKIG